MQEMKPKTPETVEEKSLDSTKKGEKKIKQKQIAQQNAVRFNAEPEKGLDDRQVAERMEQGLYNKTGKKYSKSYKSIFIGNICTFFNFLCLLAAIALIAAKAPITQLSFVLIYALNITVSIVQEIRAKLKIDKLTILSSPTAKVIRNGVKKKIPITEIVLDDILLLSAGQQVPADCIAVDGAAELNEALLTGESVPIKKEDGDLLYAGSFVSSGHIAVRVDRIGDETYISQLTARAKKYKRPNSEIMNSINLFIKAIGLMIIPVALFMFFTNYQALPNANWDAVKENGFWASLLGGDITLQRKLGFYQGARILCKLIRRRRNSSTNHSKNLLCRYRYDPLGLAFIDDGCAFRGYGAACALQHARAGYVLA